MGERLPGRRKQTPWASTGWYTNAERPTRGPPDAWNDALSLALALCARGTRAGADAVSGGRRRAASPSALRRGPMSSRPSAPSMRFYALRRDAPVLTNLSGQDFLEALCPRVLPVGLWRRRSITYASRSCRLRTRCAGFPAQPSEPGLTRLHARPVEARHGRPAPHARQSHEPSFRGIVGVQI